MFRESYTPVNALHGDNVFLDYINNPEPAHTQPVIFAPVKTLRRVGI